MRVKTGTNGRDRLLGSKADDTLVGLGGNDVLMGREGNDMLEGGKGSDRLDGGTGDDRLDGGLGADVMIGGAGNDTYVVDNVDDRIIEHDPLLLPEINRVESWIDYRLGENLQDLALMGSAIRAVGNGLDNRLFGNELKNILVGNGGADQLYGFDGRDRLDGGEGDDYLDGGSGDDTMIGGVGNDTYVVDSDGDVIIDSGGLDSVLLAAPLWQFVMGEGIENLTIIAAPIEPGDRISVIGNELGNRIDGGAGNDIIDGAGGNDLLWGGDGWDTIYAGGGDDIVVGSEGADNLYLGGNRDVVIYQAVSEIVGDTIAQFSTVARIDLSVIDAGSAPGDQAFTYLGSAAFTGREGEIRCETNSGGFYTRVSFDLDGDKVADLQFFVEGSPPTETSFNL